MFCWATGPLVHFLVVRLINVKKVTVLEASMDFRIEVQLNELKCLRGAWVENLPNAGFTH